MKSLALLLLLSAVAPAGFASNKDSQGREPVVWGMLSGNAGCVIFAEGRQTKGMFWGVAVTTKTTGKLTVIETQNYTPDGKVYLETQDNMDALMRTAQKDNIKFVKIPEKYTPQKLDQARAECTSASSNEPAR